MFRDFKSGGYKLEGTNVTGERLVVMVLLIAIAYNCHNAGKKNQAMGIQNISVGWRGRAKWATAQQFYIGLYGQTWVNFERAQMVAELMILTCNKRVLSKGSEGYGAYPVYIIASLSPTNGQTVKLEQVKFLRC